MTHPLAGQTCTVVGGEAMGVRGVVIDGYAGLLGTPVGLGRDRIGPQSEMVYVIVFQVTNVPNNLARDYVGHLFSVRATQVRIDRELTLEPPEPTFNHTRGDGPENPCPECLKKMTRDQLLAHIVDLERDVPDPAQVLRNLRAGGVSLCAQQEGSWRGGMAAPEMEYKPIDEATAIQVISLAMGDV